MNSSADANRTVVFVASHLAPVLGLERVLLGLLSELSASITADVVCLGGDASDEVAYTSVTILGSPLRGLSRLKSIARSARFARTIPPGLPIVVVGVWAAIPWLLAVRPGTAAHTIVWEHSLVSEKVRSSRSVALLYRFARLLYRRAGAIVAVSGPLADDMSRLPGVSSARHIPNFVEGLSTMPIPKGEADTDGGVIQLISVGSLTSTKNHKTLIRSMSLLPSHFRLSIFGEGPERASLANLSASLRLEDRVRLFGFTPRSEVLTAMGEADVMVHASIGETFGVVYVEAAMTGIPVVAVRNRAASEMIPRYAPGALSDNSPAALAEAVLSVLDNPPTSSEYAMSMRFREATFGAASVTRQWKTVISDVRQSHKNSRKVAR